jgi:hypothetical protein
MEFVVMLQFALNLKARLFLIFAAFGLLCIVVAGIGVKGIADANGRALRVYEQLTLPSQYVQNVYRIQAVQAIQMLEALSLHDESAKKERYDLIDKLQQSVDQQFELFIRCQKPDVAKPIAMQFARDRELYERGFTEAFQLARSGNTAAAAQTQAYAKPSLRNCHVPGYRGSGSPAGQRSRSGASAGHDCL